MIKRTYRKAVAYAVLLLCVLGIVLSMPSKSAPAFADIGYGKLFKWQTPVEEKEDVYIGGFPLGFGLNTDGVLVDEIGTVETEAGTVAAQTDLMKGDLIIAVEQTPIRLSEELDAAVENGGGTRLNLTVRRGEQTLNCWVQPLKEALTGKFRLGIWVREQINGIGTVGFVWENRRYVALGHAISVDRHDLPVSGGSVYGCRIVGVEKGRRGKAGELQGVLNASPIGTVEENTAFGIYGTLDRLPDTPKYRLGSRESVTVGKAQLYTTVDDKADFYDIEIIRAMAQNKRSDKSMVIRVTDKRLKEKTGGIVQGMSGSPIVQNDRIIGLVTHVFINDPLKGYGIYADWLQPE